VCRRSLFVETNSAVADRHPAWGKLAIMRKYLAPEKDFDWVVWTDCDTFFMNHEIPLAALFTRPDLVVTEDGNMLNTVFKHKQKNHTICMGEVPKS
jgi:hypothetical protein